MANRRFPTLARKLLGVTLPGCLILAALFLLVLRDSPPSPTPEPPALAAAVKPPLAEPLPLATHDSNQMMPATPVSITAPAPHPAPGVRPVPASLARVFPDLEAAVEDWREFHPATLTIAPHPDLPITFTRTALRKDGPYVTWIGRNAGLPGASLVGVATANGYDAVLVLPGASEFSFHVRGDKVVVDESTPGAEGCGVDPVQQPKLTLGNGPTILDIRAAKIDAPTTTDVHAITAPTVDVLFAYDAETLAIATGLSSDPVGYIDGQCKARIETSNLTLGQSGINTFVWRHLGVVAAPSYNQTGETLDDIEALAPNGTLADWVRTSQYEYGVDQLMLLLGGDRDYGGRAYSYESRAVTRPYAVAVMRWRNSYFTLVHELAHNFGCQHDRAHIEVLAPGEYGPPAPDNDGFYYYGHMWENPPGGGNTGTAGTIMSYADWRIPYFSNPDISVHVTGETFGWSDSWELGTHQIGRPVTDPKAAFNARVLNERAEAMTQISQEITTPAFTQHPQSTTVVTGRFFSLSVIATGGGLSYQWLKGGVPIENATATSYSKIADSSEPSGYSVMATNRTGSVTSNVATVTVTAAPPPSSGGGGGGGGGGGAPSAWFCGVLALLGLARWLCPRRN